MKIPEADRPTLHSVFQTIENRVGKPYRDLLVSDAQNDCACNIESYEADGASCILYVDENGKIKRYQGCERICLPMVSNFHQDMLIDLFAESFRQPQDFDNMVRRDLIPFKILTNAHNNIQQLRDMYQHVFGRKCYEINWEFAFLDFLPLNQFYVVPEPEFFGVLSANLGGMGAFCIATHVFRV